MRTEVAAPPRDDDAADFFLTTNAGFGFAPIDAMLKLVFTVVPVGIHVIRNGGASKTDRGR